MDIDEAYKHYGEFKPKQKTIFWAIGLTQLFMACHNIHNVYLGATPAFDCVQGSNKIVEGCPSDGQQCVKYDFTRSNFTSIVSEWNLVCEHQAQAVVVQSVYFGGLVAGSLIFGTIADQFGRKIVVCITILGMALGTCGGALATTYIFYCAMRFFAGFCCGGYIIVAFVYVTEVVGPSKRGYVGTVYPVLFALGIMYWSTLAYLITHWRILSLASAVPGFIGIYFFWLLPESPRWLLSQTRRHDAEYAIEYLVRDKSGLRQPVLLADTSADKSNPSMKRTDGIMQLLKHSTLRSRTLNNLYTWFVNCAVYYGLTISAGNLSSNMYISVSLSGLVEIPAYILTMYSIERFGRKLSYSPLLIAAGIFCVAVIFIPKDFTSGRTACALIGKMCISISFCVAFVYTAEMYPTTIRNKAMGMINTSARIGGMLCPLIISMAASHPGLDFLTFGIMAFTAGLISLRLPETLNQRMPETVDDIDDIKVHRQIKHYRDKAPNVTISEENITLLEEKVLAKIEENQMQNVDA